MRTFGSTSHRLCLPLLVCLAAACGGTGSGDDPLPSPGAAAAGPSTPTSGIPTGWYVEYPDGQTRGIPDGVVLPDDLPPVLAPGGDAGAAALDFLAKYPDVFGMRDPRAALDVSEASTDDAGETHVRLEQVAGPNRVPVFGAEIIVSFDANGAPFYVDGAYVPGLDALAAETPKIDGAAATSAAAAELTASFPAHLTRGTTTSAPSLTVWVPDVEDEGASPALAQLVDLASYEVVVDAITGVVLHVYTTRSNVDVTGSGTDVHGNARSFQLYVDKGPTYLMDRSPTAELQEIAATRVTAASARSFEVTTYSSASPTGDWDAVAVEGYANVLRVDQFYRERLNRHGYDPKLSGFPIVLHFNDDGNRFNAFWDGQGRFLAFGDGNATSAPIDGFPPSRPFDAAIDVVAHEYTHAVTQFTSRLLYERQPGAINEAVSDVFGAVIEHEVRGASDDNFLLGEDIILDGTPIRDMLHPSHEAQRAAGVPHLSVDEGATSVHEYVPVKKPSDKNDFGDVHRFTTVGGLAFALMVRGGVHPANHIVVPDGLGWTSARRLWWNAERHGLRRRSKWANLARTQTLFARRDKQVVTPPVACAWRGVGALSLKFLERIHVECPNDPGAAGDRTNVCTDKIDGIYCDPDIGAAYVCRGGSPEDLLQCPAGRQCVGPNGPGDAIVCE